MNTNEKMLNNSTLKSLLKSLEDGGYADQSSYYTVVEDGYAIRDNRFSTFIRQVPKPGPASENEEIERIMTLTSKWYRIKKTEAEELTNKIDSNSEDQCESSTQYYYRLMLSRIRKIKIRRIVKKDITNALHAFLLYGSIATLFLICIFATFGVMGFNVLVCICYSIAFCASCLMLIATDIKKNLIEIVFYSLIVIKGASVFLFNDHVALPFMIVTSFVFVILAAIFLASSESDPQKDNIVYLSENTNTYINYHRFNRLIMLLGLIAAAMISVPFGGHMENKNILALVIIPIMLIFQRFRVNQVSAYPDIKKYEDRISHIFTAVAVFVILAHIATATKEFQEVFLLLNTFIEGIVVSTVSCFDAVADVLMSVINALDASIVVILIIAIIVCCIVDGGATRRKKKEAKKAKRLEVDSYYELPPEHCDTTYVDFYSE